MKIKNMSQGNIKEVMSRGSIDSQIAEMEDDRVSVQEIQINEAYILNKKETTKNMMTSEEMWDNYQKPVDCEETVNEIKKYESTQVKRFVPTVIKDSYHWRYN